MNISSHETRLLQKTRQTGCDFGRQSVWLGRPPGNSGDPRLQEELRNDINWLELRVARLVLQHFQDALTGQHVLLLTDNVTTKQRQLARLHQFQGAHVRSGKVMSVGREEPAIPASRAHFQGLQHSSNFIKTSFAI